MSDPNERVEGDPMYQRVPRSLIKKLYALCEEYGSGGILVAGLCSIIGPSEVDASRECVSRLYGKMRDDQGFDEVLVDETK